MNYTLRLEKAIKSAGTCLCVGLDPDLDRIPASIQQATPDKPGQVVSFLKKVIDQTHDHCAAYKPNLGFFEALGATGLEVFREVIDYIPESKIIVADIKRGDISSTAEHYAKAYFEVFGVDAVTINPLMGFESLVPFWDYPGKGIYTLSLTSNPGAKDFLMKPFDGFSSMAAYIADTLSTLQKGHPTHLGMVIGATKTDIMQDVLKHHKNSSLLIPGIGAQGGSVEDLEQSLKGHDGLPLINSSRSILYAGEQTAEWPEAIRNKSQELKELLNPITQKYVT